MLSLRILLLMHLMCIPFFSHTEEKNTLILDQENMNSVIILEGNNTLHSFSVIESGLRGIAHHINWDQIPNITFPKNEITSIQIIRRKLDKYSENKMVLIPFEWVFSAPTWSIRYMGRIPYLENLDFLDASVSTKLSTKIVLTYIQNDLGYYQDQVSRKTGPYNGINKTPKEIIEKILIISEAENRSIHDMRNEFDTLKHSANNSDYCNRADLNDSIQLTKKVYSSKP